MGMRMSNEEYRELYYRTPARNRGSMPRPDDDEPAPKSRGSSNRYDGAGGRMASAGKSAASTGGSVMRQAGAMGGKLLTSALTSFTKGRFKGIRHPDDTIDPRMRHLYLPNAGRCSPLGRKPTVRELYFGRSREERENR